MSQRDVSDLKHLSVWQTLVSKHPPRAAKYLTKYSMAIDRGTMLIRRIALHEAGHAVVAWAVGARIEQVTLGVRVHGTRILGAAVIAHCPSVIQKVVYLQAGAEAERRAGHEPTSLSLSMDRDALRSICGPAYARKARNVACGFVCALWPAIVRVAEELLSKKNLSGPQVVGCCKMSLRPKPTWRFFISANGKLLGEALGMMIEDRGDVSVHPMVPVPVHRRVFLREFVPAFATAEGYLKDSRLTLQITDMGILTSTVHGFAYPASFRNGPDGLLSFDIIAES